MIFAAMLPLENHHLKALSLVNAFLDSATPAAISAQIAQIVPNARPQKGRGGLFSLSYRICHLQCLIIKFEQVPNGGDLSRFVCCAAQTGTVLYVIPGRTAYISAVEL